MNDEFDGYIVVAFSNATLVLSIGETVEEVNDSGFLGTVPTLRVQLLQDNSLIQVCICCLSPLTHVRTLWLGPSLPGMTHERALFANPFPCMSIPLHIPTMLQSFPAFAGCFLAACCTAMFMVCTADTACA